MSLETRVLEVHKLAQYFYERSGADSVVILTNNPEAVYGQYPETTRLFVVKTPLQIYRRKRGAASLPINSTMVRLKDLSEDFLKNKIFVCVDYLKIRAILATPSFRNLLNKLSVNALISVMAVDKKGGWTLNKLKRLVDINPAVFLGLSKRTTSSSSKNQLLAISGRITNILEHKYPLVRVLAIVPQFNERDIIAQTIKHLISQGVDVHVIDNWSDDGSYEIVQELAGHYKGHVTFERFPAKKALKYDLRNTLKHINELAIDRINEYQWIMKCDSDELRWSPWKGVSLQEAISFVDHMGYNCIDSTLFTFRPTRDGFDEKIDPVKFFRYGEFGKTWAFLQVNTWKNHIDADISSSGGHLILLPQQKIFPFKFLLCHYPLRSSEQSRRKIFKERLPRYSAAGKKRGWHIHYNHFEYDQSFILSPKGFVKFDVEKFFTDYLVERVSGIGV